MPSFPRTYPIIRGGLRQAVAVADAEALLALRTELELVLQLGRAVTDHDAAALQARLAGPSDSFGANDRRRTDLADLLAILQDARAPANEQTVAAIDAEFPEMADALDLRFIRQERSRFSREVEEALRRRGPTQRRAPGRSPRAAAASGSAVPAPPAAPASAPQEAYGAMEIIEKLAADADRSPALGGGIREWVEPASERTASTLAASPGELAEIAGHLTALAGQIQEVVESLAAPGGAKESASSPERARSRSGRPAGRKTRARRAPEPPPAGAARAAMPAKGARDARTGPGRPAPVPPPLEEVKASLAHQIDRLAELWQRCSLLQAGRAPADRPAQATDP